MTLHTFIVISVRILIAMIAYPVIRRILYKIFHLD